MSGRLLNCITPKYDCPALGLLQSEIKTVVTNVQLVYILITFDFASFCVQHRLLEFLPAWYGYLGKRFAVTKDGSGIAPSKKNKKSVSKLTMTGLDEPAFVVREVGQFKANRMRYIRTK